MVGRNSHEEEIECHKGKQSEQQEKEMRPGYKMAA